VKKISLFIKIAIALGAMGLLIYFNRLDLSMFRNLGEGWPWFWNMSLFCSVRALFQASQQMRYTEF
jgi:hypothetical protein